MNTRWKRIQRQRAIPRARQYTAARLRLNSYSQSAQVPYSPGLINQHLADIEDYRTDHEVILHYVLPLTSQAAFAWLSVARRITFTENDSETKGG
jgi:hypothetical protein